MKRTKKVNKEKELLQASITSLVIESFKSTGYLIINKTLMESIGLIHAVFLSYLIDKFQYWILKKDTKNNDFFCTHDKISEELGISEHQIREAKKYLVGHKYISTYRSGTPAKEFYQINFDILYRGLVLQKLEDLPSNNHGTIYNKTKYSKTKDNQVLSETASSDKVTLKERNRKFLPLANQLASIIKTKKDIKPTPSQLKAWANEIRLLSEQSEVEYSRIKKALRWYSQNIGGEFIPVIESGNSLRNKFMKLENAVGRNGYKHSNKSENTVGSRMDGSTHEYQDKGKTI